MRNTSEIGCLYINGLGKGTTTLEDKVVRWWWRRAGHDIQQAHINWYDGQSLEAKLTKIEQKVTDMLTGFGGVALIGSSAVGSLAINAYYRLRDKNICAINAHGRLASGNYSEADRRSLYNRAHLASNRPSQSFYDSVIMAETDVIPKLSQHDKDRMLVLTQLTDLVVPLQTMDISGVEQHRAVAFGHSGGFAAHLVADRDIIADFARTQLQKHVSA